jgi:hypothetical protein
VEAATIPTSGLLGKSPGSRVGDVLSGTTCGTAGAMAMTGRGDHNRARVGQAGPAPGRRPAASSGHARSAATSPRKQRRGLIEAAHWAFGAGGGAAFGGFVSPFPAGEAGHRQQTDEEAHEHRDGVTRDELLVVGAGDRDHDRRDDQESTPRATARQRRCGTGYFLACSKYGLVPEAWSVTSTTRSISETAWVIATSMP